mmetsp:Transcript_97384/g.303686  ORF Transcript_97384/g.303686 Transcript_97384/m.303686 type:complete len:384 (+) Transcript_97384:388-1539(+)
MLRARDDAADASEAPLVEKVLEHGERRAVEVVHRLERQDDNGKLDAVPLLLCVVSALDLLLEELRAREGERTAELEDQDAGVGLGVRPVLDVAPPPPKSLDPAELHRLGLRGVRDDHREGHQDRQADAVDHAEEEGEDEGDAPDDHVPLEAALAPRPPELHEFLRCLEINQTARGLHDDRRERGLGQVHEGGRQEDEAETDDAGGRDAPELRLHAAVRRQPCTAQRAARSEGSEERAADACHAQGDHLLRGIELVAIVQSHLLRGGVRGEEGGERHKNTARDEVHEPRPVADQVLVGGDVPGRLERRQACRNVPNSDQNGFSAWTALCRQVSKQSPGDRHHDLLHLREALYDSELARGRPTLLDPPLGVLLQSVELVEHEDQD